MIHELDQRGYEGFVDVVSVGLEFADGDGDVAQMAGWRRKGGPGGNDGAAVQHAVQLVCDILLGGALMGDGVAHFVSGLPVGV